MKDLNRVANKLSEQIPEWAKDRISVGVDGPNGLFVTCGGEDIMIPADLPKFDHVATLVVAGAEAVVWSFLPKEEQERILASQP